MALLKQNQIDSQIIFSSVSPVVQVDKFWYDLGRGGLYQVINSIWQPIGHGGIPFNRKVTRIFTDFLSNSTTSEILSSVTGGSISQPAVIDPTRPGIVTLSTSNNNTGRARLNGNLNQIIFGNGVTWIHDTLVRIPTVSNSTDSFYCYCGFSNDHYSPPSNCVLAMYTHTNAIDTGTWRLVNRNNGTESFQDSDTMIANTWYRVTVIVINNTQSELYINGVLKATLTTNIPTNSGRQVSFATGINKYGTGTTPRTFDLDYLEVLGVFDNSR